MLQIPVGVWQVSNIHVALSVTSGQGAGEGLKSARPGPQGLGAAPWRAGQGFTPTASIRRLCHGTRHLPDEEPARSPTPLPSPQFHHTAPTTIPSPTSGVGALRIKRKYRTARKNGKGTPAQQELGGDVCQLQPQLSSLLHTNFSASFIMFHLPLHFPRGNKR